MNTLDNAQHWPVLKEMSCIVMLTRLKKSASSRRLLRHATRKSSNSSTSLPNKTEVKKWGTSFNMLLTSQSGRAYFTEFLKSQYCDENIRFYNAVLSLRKINTEDEDAVFLRCKTIYKQFICITSSTEISISAVIRDKISEEMINPDKTIFDDALEHIYDLMYRDAYPRFKNSPMYKHVLEKAKGRG